MAPRVSAVLAVYNVERELPVLLESLCASRFRNFELCVCDDASTDATAEVLRRFSDRLDMRVVKNERNLGVTASRNAALALAGAPLLLFLDADVRLPVEGIGRLIKSLESRKANVVCGIYSDHAVDDGLFSRFYALFIHYTMRLGPEPVEYNVFNAWCALAEREVFDRLGGHKVVSKGVEVENESLGRRITAAGHRLLLDPSVACDHHWGGHGKLVFIFTKRVYWWVKIFFADGFRFEKSLTTPGYGFASLAALGFTLCGVLTLNHPYWAAGAAFCALVFLNGYGGFILFALRRRGLLAAARGALLSFYFSHYAALSAIWSASEELLLWPIRRRFTLAPTDLR